MELAPPPLSFFPLAYSRLGWVGGVLGVRLLRFSRRDDRSSHRILGGLRWWFELGVLRDIYILYISSLLIVSKF